MSILRRFSNVPKFFYQGDEGDDEAIDYMKCNLGLKPLYTGTDEETHWETFSRQVKRMNILSSKSVQYKVFIFSCYPSNPDTMNHVRNKTHGMGSVPPTGSSMRDDGSQRRDMHSILISQIKYENMPLPQSFYTSSSGMALQMLDMTYSRLPFRNGQRFKPLGHELLRESRTLSPLGSYDDVTAINDVEGSSSSSSSSSSEAETAPAIATTRETNADRETRMRYFLYDLFEHDDSTFISVTCHAELLAALLRVIGHRPFQLVPGELLPVLIKCE